MCVEFVLYAVPVCVRAWLSVHPRVGSLFVRESVCVSACVCMHFCKFVSASFMRSYLRSCACCES